MVDELLLLTILRWAEVRRSVQRLAFGKIVRRMEEMLFPH